ncbi:MAG: hypothetical protein EHM42_02885, partial [Planctomycetaceae bacterium]
MRFAIRLAVISLALGVCAPIVATRALAQGHVNCCNRCQLPVPRCCCVAGPKVTYQPVVETQYTQRQVLQERDQVATEYRAEPVQETVPATVVENVTVDEGGYQTVWVPRLISKPVARTVYQTRTSYRSVPYQVTRRVQEYAWQTVPTQTVRYVPTTDSAVAARYAPYGAPAVSAVPVAPGLASNQSALGLAPDPRFSMSSAPVYTPQVSSNYSRYEEYQPVGGGYGNPGVAGGPSLS